MKSRMAFGIVVLVALVALWVVCTRHKSGQIENPSAVQSTAAVPAPAANAVGGRKRVVVQTGPDRMSNAVRCMKYVSDLAMSMSNQHASDKSMLMALAGVLFYHDALMAKAKNGYITTTTNQLRQDFANGVAQMFTNKVPPGVSTKLTNALTFDGDAQQRLNTINQRIDPEAKQPYLTMVNGFDDSFSERNNGQVSIDQQYGEIAQTPNLGATLQALDKAFQQAGIEDADQSDLKQMCLGLNEMRTTAYEIYGPKGGVPQPEEFKTMSDALDQVLMWRLVNMYGLDDPTAQAVVQAVSKIPVRGFSHEALQPPAYLQ